MINKNCSRCSVDFVVTDEDREFLDKMEVDIGGRKFELPLPNMCRDCRSKQRMTFRNTWALYRRKCDTTGQDMVSMFNPDCKYKIYHRDIWYSDVWDPMQYGREVDFSRSFFDQLQELFLAVPLFHNSVADDENSDFSNNSNLLKNCYMTQDSTESENCLYGNAFGFSRDCVDCTKVINCEGCYEVVNAYDCYGCYYSTNLKNCRESYWLDGCVGCNNCFGCKNLNNKQYYIFNQSRTKDEYEKFIELYVNGDKTYRTGIEGQVKNLWVSEPSRFAQVYSSEDCTGDYIGDSRQVKDCLLVDNSENIRYSMVINRSKDFMDVESFGLDSERVYCSVTVGLNANNVCFCNEVWENVANVYYSWFCGQGAKDCFGCAGLRGKQYCILNKQYSKEEYEELVPKIIEHMQRTGEWGKFFPMSFSPFGYNETIANEYYPLTKEQALAMGANWCDKPELQYSFDQYYQPLPIRQYDPQVNAGAQGEIDKCLQGVIKCDVAGRPFRIISQELYFYIKRGLPVPTVHPDERRRVRNRDINRAKFFKRQCDCGKITDDPSHATGQAPSYTVGQAELRMTNGERQVGCDHGGRCGNWFETTYELGKGRVYCEWCYRE
ncbi:hypothetical protein KJ855_01015 [Patescibacteria group bacterium]|nr:hypothetical protein [Patescibacteria group bacterium]